MVSSTTWVLLPTLFGQLLAGDFIGKVKVEFKVFTVVKSGYFEIKCTAQHEDKTPQLRWYKLDKTQKRTNITGFTGSGQTAGNIARNTLTKTNVQLSDSGDYYCEAKVDNDLKTSVGVPILVIEQGKEPYVKIKKSYTRTGNRVFTCSVVPQGLGFLSWYRDGDRLKYEKKVSELKLETNLPGRYTCRGNLTIGGYSYFQSSAYTSGAVGWYHMVSQQVVYLSTVLMCLFTLTNFAIL